MEKKDMNSKKSNMGQITSFYVFIAVVDGQEKVMMAPNNTGLIVPLAYNSEQGIEEAKVKQFVETLVEEYKGYFELREYKLTRTLEVFEPVEPGVKKEIKEIYVRYIIEEDTFLEMFVIQDQKKEKAIVCWCKLRTNASMIADILNKV